MNVHACACVQTHTLMQRQSRQQQLASCISGNTQNCITVKVARYNYKHNRTINTCTNINIFVIGDLNHPCSDVCADQPM